MILFDLVMNMIVNLTITIESVPGSRWILQGLEQMISWARMRFKSAKSRSLLLKKGKVVAGSTSASEGHQSQLSLKSQ